MKKELKILVLDDEENVLKSVKKVILTEYPHAEVELVKLQDQCMELNKKRKYDLFITDLIMPGVSGINVMEQIRKIDPELKIIVITGYPTMKTYLASIKAGASHFIPKPFTREELISAINRTM